MAQSRLLPLLWPLLAAYLSFMPWASCAPLMGGRGILDHASYQDMAAEMVPQQCGGAMAGLEMLTQDTVPEDVRYVRQPILVCRDVLDIFVFAYAENVTIDVGTDNEQVVDVWKMFRKDTKRVYHNLGKYHDLVAMKVPYTRKAAEDRLNRALEAKMTLLSNAERFGYLDFVSNPAATLSARNHCKLSRFFWNLGGNYDAHPRDDLDGLENMALLMQAMLNRIADNYDAFMSLEGIWERERHDEFHAMRKLIRSTRRMVELVPAVVSDYRPVTKAISLLDESYRLFGDLNDILESYSWYESHAHLDQLPEMEREITEAWARLRGWVRERKFTSTFGWLSLHLHGALYDVDHVSLNDLDEIPEGVLYSTAWPLTTLDSLASAMTAAWLFNGSAVCAGKVDRTAQMFLEANHVQPLPSLGSAYQQGRAVGLIGQGETGDVAPEVRSHMNDVAVVIDNQFAKADSLFGSAMAQFVLLRHVDSTSAVMAELAMQNTRRRLPSHLANMLLAGILTATNNLTSAMATIGDLKAVRQLLPLIGTAALDPTLEGLCLQRRCGTAREVSGKAGDGHGEMRKCDRSCLADQFHEMFVTAHGGNNAKAAHERGEPVTANADVIVGPRPPSVEILTESEWELSMLDKADAWQPMHSHGDSRLVLENIDYV